MEFSLAKLAAVMTGSALGGGLRWVFVEVVERHWKGFPWGTLLVNIFGSLAIGIVAGMLSLRGGSPVWRLFLMTGLLGGFTTFSAFSLQTLALFGADRWFAGAAYVAASIACCVGAAWLGFWISGR